MPYLHPEEPTVQLDLLGSKQVIEWQEGKAAFLFASEGCWSELPHLYARYGTTATAQLIAKLRTLEQASAALVCDSGMQATALAFDALMEPSTTLRASRAPRGADAPGLQQDPQLSRVDGRACRRNDHHRRRRRCGGAGGGDPARDAVRVRGDLHQSAGARPGFRRVAGSDDAGARDRAGDPPDPRHNDRLAVGVQHSSAPQRRRHCRGQRHQVAGRQRSRYVGLHRHQRQPVRELGHGLDGDARRHPRLAPGRGGGRGV